MTALDLEPIDLPRLTVPQRIRETIRLAHITLTTGRHTVAEAYSDGMKVGMNGGFSAALGEFNARLSAQGIDPIRGAR